MTKLDFMKLMNFPDEWYSLGMYTDELFEIQVANYQPGHEDGSEHDRNGAFHWWLQRVSSRDELEKLLRLAALDPDPYLGNDLREYIRKSKFFDMKINGLDNELFRGKQA